MDKLDPYSMDDLLKAHGVMMNGLVNESGEFRSSNVGVVDSEGNIIHFGTLPQYISGLMQELLDWTKVSDIHMLIKSCVFHYEFELVHPFVDGNGRMGRLWHTLLLSEWNPIFAWIPIEYIIHDNQSEYYNAINISNNNGESTVFVEFMLSVIKQALLEADESNISKISAENRSYRRWNLIRDFLNKHEFISNHDIQEILGVSSSTATRVLVQFTKNGKLRRIRQNNRWYYTTV